MVTRCIAHLDHPLTQINIGGGGADYSSDEDSLTEDDGMDDLGGEPLYYDPCACCTQGNSRGFTCPIPVPTAPGQQIPSDRDPPTGHVLCKFCGQLMPIRNIPTETCASCHGHYCGGLGHCGLAQIHKFGGTPYLTRFVLTWCRGGV